MIALPEDPGVGGAVVLALGLLLGAAAAPWVWRRFQALAGSRSAAALLSLALVSALATAPFLSWRIVQDLRYTVTIPREVAERIGAYEGDLNGGAFDLVLEAIASDETYYLAAGGGLGSGDFGAWAHTVLLPRIAVDDPAKADWILTLGLDPRTVGPRVDRVRVLTTYQDGMYLARVVP